MLPDLCGWLFIKSIFIIFYSQIYLFIFSIIHFILKFFWNRHLRIVFVESYCRVTSLSTTGIYLFYFIFLISFLFFDSGKLLYYLPIADGFVVHWPQLKAKYTRTETLGAII